MRLAPNNHMPLRTQEESRQTTVDRSQQDNNEKSNTVFTKIHPHHRRTLAAAVQTSSNESEATAVQATVCKIQRQQQTTAATYTGITAADTKCSKALSRR